MKIKQILGIMALILAGVVVYMAYSESQGIVSSLSSALNAQPSDNVMLKYAASGILAVLGIFLLKK